MQIRETRHDTYSTLAPVGDLDANSSMQMDDAIQQQIDSETYNLHIDCAELEYISSAGLGVFISFMEELENAGGKFVFSNMADNILQVFKLLGLESLVTVVNDRAEVEKEYLHE
ncbi:MAG: STAS domain-containing protein [Bacteroidota bacterium]